MLQVLTFAGSGVILSTALVHVLLPANEALTSPCLSDFWRGYEAWAFMICTASIIGLQVCMLCRAWLDCHGFATRV